MEWLFIAIVGMAFASFIGIGIIFAFQKMRMKNRPLHGDLDDENGYVREAHCDAYSAGTFYW